MQGAGTGAVTFHAMVFVTLPLAIADPEVTARFDLEVVTEVFAPHRGFALAHLETMSGAKAMLQDGLFDTSAGDAGCVQPFDLSAEEGGERLP
ncbi:hypothetical protein AAW51_0493 [Caldimonas brevitalea]|uniref:Uncharacterized protein n=1 Tax=Caldimonas brevitalea TaxID=413882 RepID=A0A0G3BCS8_9BURK|nr:hypothetical protein AAW51_0493 [Caldimonas brevitalea]